MEYRYRDASEMKDSGVEWIGKIPKDWEISRIKNFTSLRSIKGKENEQLLSLYRDYGVVPKNSRDDNFNRASEDLSNYKYVEKDNLVLNKMKVWQGSLAVSQFKGIVSPAYIICELNSSKIVPRYAHYSLRNKKYIPEYRRLSTGIRPNQWDINYEDFKNIKGTLPKLSEQEKIANFLDKKTSQFDSIISKKEVLIEKLEEAKKSLISEVVTGKVKVVKTDDEYDLVKRNSDEMKDSGVEWLGNIPKDWENIKIKRLSRIGRGASPRPIDDPVYFDENGEYAWTRIADVSKSNKYLTKTEQKMSERGSLLSVKLEINKLFLSIAGSVGKPCITGIKACIHDGFVYFPDLKDYLNDYLYYIFYGGQCYKGLGKLGTQLNLNRETVGDIKIGIPKDKEEVNYITSFLEQYLYQIDKLITSIESQIEKLKEAKQSLISEAVTGKIEILD